MKKKHIQLGSLFLIVFLNFTALGQNFSSLKHKWKKPTPQIEIPDSLKNEDVVIISKTVYINNHKDVTSSIPLFASGSVLMRYRVQTKAGLDYFTKFSLSKSRGAKPTTIDARTIKKDGTTINLDRDNIKLLRSYNKLSENYFYEYRLSVPGVEIGDEVEIVYSNSYNEIISTMDLFFHDDYAIMESKVVITTDRGIITNILLNNGLPDPIRVEAENESILTWKLTSLRPIGEQYNMIEDYELPFVRMIVTEIKHQGSSYDVGIKDWGAIFDRLAPGSLEQKYKPKGLEEYFNSLKSKLDTLSTTGKVNYFAQFINDEIEIRNSLNDGDDKLSYVDLFSKKIIDEINLINFYKHMFFQLKIPYKVILAKNRYQGELLVSDISSRQITDVFFEFRDEKDAKHYLFLSNESKTFSIDELPYSLEGTKAILLKKQDPFSKEKPEVEYMNIGYVKMDNNTRKINTHIKIDEAGTLTRKTQLNYNGHFSTTFRRDLTELCDDYKKDEIIDYLEIEDKDKANFVLDTLFKIEALQTFPYTNKFELRTHTLNAISDGGSDIKNLDLDLIINHIAYRTTKGERYYTSYLPYTGQESIITLIEFPYAIEVINIDDIKINKLNSIGSHELKLEKINPTTFRLSSVFTIAKSIVVPAKYPEFVELNESIKKNKEFSILFKKL